jgi:hypothetical protein
MKAPKKISVETTLSPQQEADTWTKIWEEGWVYISTVIDVKKKPAVVLDSTFTVVAANEPFYLTFLTTKEEVIGRELSALGNGQWNIPRLALLLKNIIPNKTFFNGFEITHVFPIIGKKVMMLNARQIHQKNGAATDGTSHFIILVYEDVTEIMSVADSFAEHMNQLHQLRTQL